MASASLGEHLYYRVTIDKSNNMGGDLYDELWIIEWLLYIFSKSMNNFSMNQL